MAATNGNDAGFVTYCCAVRRTHPVVFGALPYRFIKLTVLFCLLLLLTQTLFGQDQRRRPIPVAPPRQSGNSVTVVVTDENGLLVSGALVQLFNATSHEMLQAYTDLAGRVYFLNLNSREVFSLNVEKQNFYEVNQKEFRVEGAQTYELMLPHVQELKEVVNVTSSPTGIDPAQTSNDQTMGTPEIINIPYPTSRDIRNLLNFLPQVVQDRTGQVHVAGGANYETRDVLDDFDITSPVSGNLAMRFSADAVRAIDVQSSRWSSQFGRASGGLVSFTTGMGDDRYRFDATNFFPSWTSKKGVSFDKWVPRATFSGPIMKGKAWFFEGADGEYDNNIFRDLPAGQDRDPVWRGSNLSKVQVNLRPNDILNAEVLLNVYDEENQGLTLINPVSTTVKRNQNASLIGLKEFHYFSGGATLELGFAVSHFRDDYRPQGDAPFFITPDTTSGNYFEAFNGRSRRAQGIANLSLTPFNAAGRHSIKLGSDIDQINFQQTYQDRPLSLLREDRTLYRQSILPASTHFERNNFEVGAYVEDRWSAGDRLLIQPGVRMDWDEIVRRPVFSPRVASSYMLRSSRETKLSAGIGIYYDRTHLDYLTRGLTGPRTDSYYGPDGTTLVGPPLVTSFIVNPGILREPRFVNWSVGIERKLPKEIYGSVEFIQKTGTDGFIFQNLNQSSILSGTYLLTNTRKDRYHSVQFTARKHFKGDYNLFGSYTRSSARSNAVVDYTLNNPIFSPQAGGPLPWDVPNRFIGWGWTPLPWTKRLDFVFSVDYRSGFPWSAVNNNQQIVGAPDSHRFPDFLSLNPGLEFRFTFHGYALALRGVAENVTGRRNPFVVDNDVDSPNFGTYSTFNNRSITARIRFLGRK